jgi:hypothetical protein
MPGVRWANLATRDAYEALISQPEAIHVPCARRPDETESDFADRLCTIISALAKAVHEFGLNGPMREWLGQVDDWNVVDWAQVAARLAGGTEARSPGHYLEKDGQPAIAA